MYTFGDINLNNIIYFKKPTTFDLGYNGITEIRGRNLCSTRKGRTNGAGKSLLLSPLPAILKNSVPTQEKNKRKLKNSLLSENSSMSLAVTIGNKSYDISKAQPKKSIKYSILEGGKDLELATNTKAEAFLENLFPISDEEFYSTIYLDSRRNSVLYTGTPSDRFKFFSDLFRLHDYDSVRAYFIKRIKDLGENQIKKNVLIEQLDRVVYCKDFDSSKLRKSNKNNLKEIDILSEKIELLQKKMSNVDLYKANINHLPLLSLDSKKIKKDLKCVEKEHKEILRHSDYKKQLKAYNGKRKALLRDVEQLKKKSSKHGCSSVKELREKLTSITEALVKDKGSIRVVKERLNTIDKQIDSVTCGIKKLNRLKSELKERPKVKGDPTAKLASVETHKKHLQQFLKGKSTGRCTICGADFTRKSAQKRLRALDKEYDELVDQVKNHARINELKMQIVTCKTSGYTKESLESLEIERVKLLKKKEAAEKKSSVDTKGLEALIRGWESINTLQKDMEKPERVSTPITKYDDHKKKARNFRSTLNTLEAILPIKSKLLSAKKECGNDDPASVQKSLKKSQSKLTTERDSLTSSIAKNSTIVEQYEKDNVVFLDITAKIKKMDKGLEDLDLYEELVDAYGAKGLKVLVIKRIAKIIEKNLNKYAPMLFPEIFKFEVSVAANSLDIQVIRDDKGKVPVSTISHLSGAETRTFSMLWAISILPLIPDNRRCNIMVLDEMEAGVDPVTVDLIRTEFLPALSQVVPHVIFITPSPHGTEIPGSRIITVEKTNKGYSHLVY